MISRNTVVQDQLIVSRWSDSDEDLWPIEHPPDEPLISVNALTRITKFQTMRVTDQVRKKPLHILIDSDSTHNFIDVNVAKKLGCKIQEWILLVSLWLMGLECRLILW